MGSPGKRVCRKRYQGFESLLLRIESTDNQKSAPNMGADFLFLMRIERVFFCRFVTALSLVVFSNLFASLLMKFFCCIALTMTFGVHALFAQNPRLITPSQTDAAITLANESHYAYIPQGSSLRNRLVVFFPGTGAVPQDYRSFQQFASTLGFHVIGLTYPNPVAINSICANTLDTACHRLGRQEVFDGTDQRADISIDRTNSIENRLVKLLQFLQRTVPNEGWGQYMIGDSVRWNRLITAGHSQGGGHAAYIATIRAVERVAIFSSTDWLTRLNRPADWMSNPKRTAASRFYGFVHNGDEQLSQMAQIRGWEALGMGAVSSVVTVDSLPTPYRKSQMLRTFATPGIANPTVQNHNATVANGYTHRTANGDFLFAPVWTYMLTDGLMTSVRDISEQSSVSIFPNPAQHLVSVQGVEGLSNLTLTNVLGQTVLMLRDVQTPATFDVSSLPNGMYFVRIQTNQTTHSQALQVIR